MLGILAACAMAPATTQQRSLNVFAAASLKESFTVLARKFEASHPGLSIKLSFGGSQTLAAQINQGAPADVFASADAKNLEQISYEKNTHRVFVLNQLDIAVRTGLPGIRSVQDLVKVKDFVVADPAVPVGHYTEAFLSKARAVYGAAWLRSIRGHIVSRETDVKAVLAKVRLGEADAGIVYVSDVASARGAVGEVRIPSNLNETAEYPVAVPARAENKSEAWAFVKFLLDRDSQRIFEKDGFISVLRHHRAVQNHRRPGKSTGTGAKQSVH